MTHAKVQRLMEQMKTTDNLNVIRIIGPAKTFKDSFDLSASKLFRTLKNGLHSFNGVPNRIYFRHLSGFYCSLCQAEEFEMIILYDSSLSNLNHLQVSTRIKKLLGISTQVEFGEYADYKVRIDEMMGLTMETQAFGSFYLKSGTPKPLLTNLPI